MINKFVLLALVLVAVVLVSGCAKQEDKPTDNKSTIPPAPQPSADTGLAAGVSEANNLEAELTDSGLDVTDADLDAATAALE